MEHQPVLSIFSCTDPMVRQTSVFQWIFLFPLLTQKSWSEFYWLLFRSLSPPYGIIDTNFKWKKLMLNSIMTSHWSWVEITQINKDLYYEMHLVIRLQSMFSVVPFEHEMHWDTQKECGEPQTRSLAEQVWSSLSP